MESAKRTREEEEGEQLHEQLQRGKKTRPERKDKEDEADEQLQERENAKPDSDVEEEVQLVKVIHPVKIPPAVWSSDTEDSDVVIVKVVRKKQDAKESTEEE